MWTTFIIQGAVHKLFRFKIGNLNARLENQTAKDINWLCAVLCPKKFYCSIAPGQRSQPGLLDHASDHHYQMSKFQSKAKNYYFSMHIETFFKSMQFHILFNQELLIQSMYQQFQFKILNGMPLIYRLPVVKQTNPFSFYQTSL